MPKKLTSQRPLLSLQNYFSNDLTDQTDQYIFVMKTDEPDNSAQTTKKSLYDIIRNVEAISL